MVWKINFSQVAKISCRLVQKWPRYKKKPQKWTLKNDFSEKSPRIFSFWKKFLKTHIKRANLAETDISGHEIYPKGPSWEMCTMTTETVASARKGFQKRPIKKCWKSPQKKCSKECQKKGSKKSSRKSEKKDLKKCK